MFIFVGEEIPSLTHTGAYVHTLYEVLIHCDETFKSYGLSTSSRKRQVLDAKEPYPTNSKYK